MFLFVSKSGLSETASAVKMGQVGADPSYKKKKERKKQQKTGAATTQIRYSAARYLDEEKIIEGRGPVTNAEGKDSRSLDFPTGRDETEAGARERERKGKNR